MSLHSPHLCPQITIRGQLLPKVSAHTTTVSAAVWRHCFRACTRHSTAKHRLQCTESVAPATSHMWQHEQEPYSGLSCGPGLQLHHIAEAATSCRIWTMLQLSLLQVSTGQQESETGLQLHYITEAAMRCRVRKVLQLLSHVPVLTCSKAATHPMNSMQGKAMGAQQQEMAAAVAAASNASRQWLVKLVGMQQLLFSAQSVQFLDIRRREAEAFKVHKLASGPESQNCFRLGTDRLSPAIML